MRVLHIGKYYPPFSGGIENYMEALFDSLNRAGVNNCGVVHNHDFTRRTVERERLPEGLIFRVPCYGTLLFAPVSPCFPVVLRRAVNSFKPDILHVHMPNTSAFWVLTSHFSPMIPMIVHWHADVVGSDIDRRLKYAYPLYRPFEQTLLRTSAKIIVTSPPYRDTSPALKPFLKKTRVIPLGIQGCAERPFPVSGHQPFAWNEGSVRVLSTGRLTYYKGHEVLVRAAAEVPGIHVVIAGDGDLRDPLHDLVSRLNIKNRITLAGHVDSRTLDFLMQSCDLFVLPSLERTEAFGLVLLEAMRAGKPAVATRVHGSGMGWVVEERITGSVVTPGSVPELSAILRKYAGDPDLCKGQGANACSRFRERFSIEASAAKILSIYEETLMTLEGRSIRS